MGDAGEQRRALAALDAAGADCVVLVSPDPRVPLDPAARLPLPRNGPGIAKTWPGDWMLANSVLLSCENVGPANSLSSVSLRARKNVSPLLVDPTRWLLPSPSSARMTPP